MVISIIFSSLKKILKVNLCQRRSLIFTNRIENGISERHLLQADFGTGHIKNAPGTCSFILKLLMLNYVSIT